MPISQLYLLKQGHTLSPLFNAHWALLVSSSPNSSPSPTPSPTSNFAGTFLHVHGSLLSGFTFEAKRSWSQLTCPEPYRAFLLGELASGAVDIAPEDEVGIPEPDESEHGWVLDPEPRTALERVLLRAPPPGGSLRSLGAGGVDDATMRGFGTTRRTRLQDCQEWIRMALPHTIQAGLLVYDEGIDVDELLSVHNQ